MTRSSRGLERGQRGCELLRPNFGVPRDLFVTVGKKMRRRPCRNYNVFDYISCSHGRGQISEFRN